MSEPIDKRDEKAEAAADRREHASGCPCCGGGEAAASPGAEEFQRRLREMIERRREQP